MATITNYASRMSNILDTDARVVKELVAKHDEILTSLLPSFIPVYEATARVILEQTKLESNPESKGKKINLRKERMRVGTILDCSRVGVQNHDRGYLLGDVETKFSNIRFLSKAVSDHFRQNNYEKFAILYTTGVFKTGVPEFQTTKCFAEAYICLIATKASICESGLEYEYGKLLKALFTIARPLASFNLLVNEVQKNLNDPLIRKSKEKDNIKSQAICTAECVHVIASTVEKFLEQILTVGPKDLLNKAVEFRELRETRVVDIPKIIAESKRQLIVTLRKIHPAK